MIDKLYYDAILESGIKQGDKVLVIGTGSGADAWVASLKSRAPVYVLEVNPMAIANARATARLVNFQIKPLCGDIREVVLPDDFKGFDFVLWNMPFVCELGRIEDNNFHDGDDGSILKRFLALLPSLLKKGGSAILLNSPRANDIIAQYGEMTHSNPICALFVVHNPWAAFKPGTPSGNNGGDSTSVIAEPVPEATGILSIYTGKNMPERKDYIMERLVVPVEE